MNKFFERRGRRQTAVFRQSVFEQLILSLRSYALFELPLRRVETRLLTNDGFSRIYVLSFLLALARVRLKPKG